MKAIILMLNVVAFVVFFAAVGSVDYTDKAITVCIISASYLFVSTFGRDICKGIKKFSKGMWHELKMFWKENT